ncbi:hypothetical protein MTR67_012857 [Solanum verrucosum]|uniref:Chromo domain-containing protein n=1 Tax=Solanum verrucosum TaxID=315347 RepID=A0AAF0QAL3_SOLVR|nr:hypothetical protein MTR67_012857 [Solanum verrucosum]
MAPYEGLYGQRCRSHIGWFEVGEAELIRPDLVHQSMKNVKIIQEKLKTAQSHQESYKDVRRRDLEFELRTKEVPSINLLWRNQFVEEETWEVEEDLKTRYPHFLSSDSFPIQVKHFPTLSMLSSSIEDE